MKKQYEKPTQVRWFDNVDGTWVGGIAYRDEIICGCCGGILELSEFEDNEVFEYEDWIDIEEEIRGDSDVAEY